MAKMLIDQLTTPFEPEKYKDDYREAVLHAIEQKVSGQQISVAPEPHRTNVIDLMSALQASLDAVRPMPEASAPTETKPKAKKTAKEDKVKETVS
jgi:DNA end-binding protein Ku